MKVNNIGLYKKMLFTPRLNLKCDGVKIRLAYVTNDAGNGWLIENLENDGETKWHKGIKTKDIVDTITEKYKDINVTWSRKL